MRGRYSSGWRFLLIQEYSAKEAERDPREATLSQKRLMHSYARPRKGSEKALRESEIWRVRFLQLEAGV